MMNNTIKSYNNNSGKGFCKEIASTFKRPELKNIVDNLPMEYKNKLLSGLYSVSVSLEDKTRICYIAGTTCPVTKQNMEFAFEVKKGK